MMLSRSSCDELKRVPILPDLVRSKALWLSFFIVPAVGLCAHAQKSAAAGTVVLSVVKDSEAEKAGIQAGDIIIGWVQAGNQGVIVSPLDLLCAERERAERGAVTLDGTRGTAGMKWILHSVPWGITSGPAGADVESVHARITELARNDVEAVAEYCRSSCGHINNVTSRQWLFLDTAKLLAESKHWKAADEFFEKAINETSRTAAHISGRIYEEWADAYQRDKQWALAKQRYWSALAEHQKIDSESLTVAYDLQNLSLMQFHVGELLQAEQLATQALHIRRKLCPNTLSVAKLLNYLGVFCQQDGDLDSAEDYLRQSLILAERLNPNGREVAFAFNNLGAVAEKRGDLSKAEQYYLRDVEIQTRLDPGEYLLSFSWSNLGTIATLRGNAGRAKDYFLKALSIQETHANQADVAMTLGNLANLFKDTGELTEAEKFLKRASAIQEQVAPRSVEFAQTLDTLGSVLHREGRLRDAEQTVAKSLELLERCCPHSLPVADSLFDLADIYREKGDLRGAEERYRAAAEIRKTLAPYNASYAECLTALAKLAEMKGRKDLAAADYERAIDVLDRQSARLGGTTESRFGFRSKYAGCYLQYISLLMRERKITRAFEVLERSHARTLLQTLAQGNVNVHTGVSAVLLKHDSQLRQALAEASDQRLRIFLAKHTDEQVANLDRRIDDLLAEQERLKAQIRSDSPRYAALIEPRPLKLSEMQRLLDRETLVLEYWLGTDQSYVFALSRNSLNAFEIPTRLVIDKLAKHIYDLWTADANSKTRIAPDRDQRRGNGELWDGSAELSDAILGSVAELIKKYARIAIVTEGSLQYIPFAGLPLPRGSASTRSFTSLIAEHEIVNLPSVSVLAVLRHQEQSRNRKYARTVAILADPVFSADDPRVGHEVADRARVLAENHELDAARDDVIRAMADTRSQAEEMRLSRLLYSRLEADTIASVLPKGESYEALDFEASRATLMNPEVLNSRILHLATHGFLDSKNPELSGLIFSMVDSAGRPQVGFYGLADVFNTTLPAELVVLSACQTASGQEVDGEGLIGLTWGFLYAGAKTVLASLWNVNDASTAELMRLFYEGMEHRQMAPAAALRWAQLDLSHQPRWASPYHWAGFTIQGDWARGHAN